MEELFAADSARAHIVAAHDLSEGGLGASLAELAIWNGVGLDIDLDGVHADATTALFSESASRVIVAVRGGSAAAVQQEADALGVPCVVLGQVTGPTDTAGDGLTGREFTATHATGSFTASVDDLAQAYYNTLPDLFGEAAGNNSVL